MADLLYELLASSASTNLEQEIRNAADPVVLDYLTTLSGQPLLAIASTGSAEVQFLSRSSHSLLLSLQDLSKRSHKAVIQSASDHAKLGSALPVLVASTADLGNAIPKLDSQVVHFSTNFHKSGENAALVARKKALLLARNVERLSDVLDLPTILSSTITSTSSNTAGYASALDLNSHIRRLHALYLESKLVSSVVAQADAAMHAMATSLIVSLRAPGLKLASGLRTVSWVRRLVPELDILTNPGHGGGLGALFLVCRLSNLMTMLAALEPLQNLAEHERVRQRQQSIMSSDSTSDGQQCERYLKRYIEIFREQSFAIVSMFKSVFPGSAILPTAAKTGPVQPVPSSLTIFPLHLINMLVETLQKYLPTIRDQTSRDSLLTQVLYCAGSLGRLGGDFGTMLASIDVGDHAETEWVEVVKRHRAMAGRLESIVSSKDKTAMDAGSAM